MTAVPDLAAWLREAITERLELARKATPGPWEPEGDDPLDDEVIGALEGHPSDCHTLAYMRGPDSHENMLHVAAADPEDTIARCEAELAILDLHVPLEDTGPPMCVICLEHVACRTIRLLGSGYRHRPGYLEEWAP